MHMQYRHLGKSGLQVSALALGSWTTYGRQVDEATAAECIRTALDAGINLFDTAEGYADGAAEKILGRAFKKAGVARPDRARGPCAVPHKVYSPAALRPRAALFSGSGGMNARHSLPALIEGVG